MPVRSSIDTRAVRTRAAITDAFISLVLERRFDAILVSDLITKANVGKSTFYDHFHGKNDVLIAAMRPVILALSTAASGRAAQSYVQSMVQHLWEHRSTGRVLKDVMITPIIQRQLAEAIRPHVEREGFPSDTAPVLATGIAAAQLAMLRCWLAGEATSTAEDMASLLIGCSHFYIADRF